MLEISSGSHTQKNHCSNWVSGQPFTLDNRVCWGRETHLGRKFLAFILRKVVTVFSPLAGIRCHNLNGLVWTQETEKAKGVRAPNRKAALLQASTYASQKRLIFDFFFFCIKEFKSSDVLIYSKNKNKSKNPQTKTGWKVLSLSTAMNSPWVFFFFFPFLFSFDLNT